MHSLTISVLEISVFWQSCFSHLVVHHHMDCTMCGVGRKLTQVERLIHNSLSSKSSVSMNQDGHHLDGPDEGHSRADTSVYPFYKSRQT